MTLLQQVFACIAVPATLILVLQTILLLVGAASAGAGAEMDTDTSGLLGGADADVEVDLDPDLPTEHAPDATDASGVRVLTVRGLVAFFAIGGWLGLAAIEWGVPAPGASALALLGGFLAMVAIAFLFKWAMRLQDSGNISLRNAQGHSAQVYLTIPARRAGAGKVTLTLQERFVECDAVTDSGESIATGSLVTVQGVAEGNTLLVAPAKDRL